MENTQSLPTCPFCPFSDQDATFVEQHIEYCHPEGGQDAPQSLSQTASAPFPTEEPDDNYIDCPHGCGETVTIAELETHLDLHVAEGIALDESGQDQRPFHTELSSEPDISDTETRDFSVTQKGGKRGADRDFTRSNTSKPTHGRSHSPVGKLGPDGAKRLGVLSTPSHLPTHG